MLTIQIDTEIGYLFSDRSTTLNCPSLLVISNRVFHFLENLITVPIKSSHSIYMSSIQIDTKTVELVIYTARGYSVTVQQHQIVLLEKLYETEFSIVYGY